MARSPHLNGIIRLLGKPKLITAAENRKPRPENLQQPASRDEHQNLFLKHYSAHHLLFYS
jgi:hypothetical protein